MAESHNLKKRIMTGSLLVSGIILTLWVDHILLIVVLLFFITFANNEYLQFWHRKDIYPHMFAVLLPGYAIPLLFYFGIPLLLPSFVLFTFISILSIIRFPGSRRTPNFLAELSAATFGVIYLSFLPSTIILLRKMGFTIALTPLVLTWLYDTFAYLTGSAIGRHKLAEKVSPKKTWEGTLCAFPLTFFCAFLLCKFWVPAFTVYDAIVLSVGIGILGTIGDLLESGMKREVGLKDASKAFPGHGGFLDRMDSLIFNIPFFYLYLLFR